MPPSGRRLSLVLIICTRFITNMIYTIFNSHMLFIFSKELNCLRWDKHINMSKFTTRLSKRLKAHHRLLSTKIHLLEVSQSIHGDGFSFYSLYLCQMITTKSSSWQLSKLLRRMKALRSVWKLREISSKCFPGQDILWQRKVKTAKADMLNLITCNTWLISYSSFTQDFTIKLSKKKPKFELEVEKSRFLSLNHDSLNNYGLRFAGRVGRLPNMSAFDELGNSKHQSWELTFYY